MVLLKCNSCKRLFNSGTVNKKANCTYCNSSDTRLIINVSGLKEIERLIVKTIRMNIKLIENKPISDEQFSVALKQISKLEDVQKYYPNIIDSIITLNGKQIYLKDVIEKQERILIQVSDSRIEAIGESSKSIAILDDNREAIVL